MAGLRSQLGLDNQPLIDFSVNTNPFGPPESVVEILNKSVPAANVYPETDSMSVREAIARQSKTKAANIIAGNGSAELLYWFVAHLRPRGVVILEPSFSDYRRAVEGNCGSIVSYKLNEKNGFRFDPETIDGLLRGADLVILGQPNNPTGRLCNKEQAVRMIERFPGTQFLVDEAFVELLDDQSEKHTLIDLVDTLKNLTVMRSLTKVYTIPGLRLGYLAANEDRIGEMLVGRAPWALSKLQTDIAVAALSEEGFISKSRERLKASKSLLFNGIADLAWLRPLRSETNFFLVRIDAPDMGGDELTIYLARRGIVVRSCRSFCVLGDKFIRIAVRSPADNRALLSALSMIDIATVTIKTSDSF